MATKKTSQSAADAGASAGLSAEEKAAMRDYARERKAISGKADGLTMVLEAIAAMPEPDRSMAERVHAIVLAAAPALAPRTWYGMPAYALDGKVICFLQVASKFKVRYSTFGFQPDAKLDDGPMWPTGFALTELTPEAEARIAELVGRAAG